MDDSDEDGEPPYVAACCPCKRIVDDAVYLGRPSPALTLTEARRFPWLRFIRDGADGVTFFREHADCGNTPLVLQRTVAVTSD